MNKLVKKGLMMVIASIIVMSCSDKKDEIINRGDDHANKGGLIDPSDVNGVWIIKGNSPIMALLVFYNGCYSIVEYDFSGSEYKFNGRFWGYASIGINGEIEINKPLIYYPEMHVNSVIQGDKIIAVPIIYPKMHIVELDTNKMKLKIGGKDFVGIKNLDYTDSYSEGSVKNEFADLGLSVNWAKCNIGATTAEAYGGYYGWGEPTGEKTSNNYDLYPCELKNLPRTITNTNYDIAKVAWGAPWRMPTLEELEELNFGCISEDVTYKGINGEKFTGITGESIFLPNAGYRDGISINHVGVSSRYWSGDLYKYNSECAYGCFSGDMGGWYCRRYIGCSVRAVRNK